MSRILRYKTPAWYASSFFPGTDPVTGIDYAFANVISEGAGSGGSSPVDGVKVGGPNAGTFFFAFGDDIITSNLNRGLAALMQNSDAFDDLFRAEHVRPAFFPVTLGAPSSTIEITADRIVYLGPVGDALNQTNLAKYFRVLTAAGDEVMDRTSLERVEFVSCDVGANSPDPPYTTTDTVFTLSHTLPAGSYLVYYGERSNYAIASDTAWFKESVLGSHRGAAELQKILTDMLGHPTTRPWVDTIDLTSYFLAQRGMQGLLDGATAVTSVEDNSGYGWPTQFSVDTPGAGGLWVRLDYGAVGASKRALDNSAWFSDGLQSVWGSYLDDNTIGNGAAYRPIAASRSFVSVGHSRGATNNGTLSSSAKAPAVAHFGAYAALDDEFSDSTKAPTKIVLPAAVTLFRSAGIDYIQLTAGTNWFWQTISAVKRSGVVLERTLLEVEWTDASEPGAALRRRTYVVTGFHASAQRIAVRPVAGGATSATFPAIPASGSLKRVLTPTFEVLDGMQELREKFALDSSVNTGRARGTFWMVEPPENSTLTADKVVRTAGGYIGASKNDANTIAFSWGGYEQDADAGDGGKYQRLGFFYGDGGIQTTRALLGGVSRIDVHKRNTTTRSAIDPVSATVELPLKLLQVDVVVVPGPTGAASTVTMVDITSGLTTADEGRELEVIFIMGATYFAKILDTTVWGSDVLFEQASDALLSARVNAIDHYKGRVILVGGTPKVLMTVRRYN